MIEHSEPDPDADLLQALAEEDAHDKAVALERARRRRREAERRRKETQEIVNQMAESTPESRVAAAKARAATVHAQIDDIAAQTDLQAVQSQVSGKEAPAMPLDFSEVRTDDLDTLFAIRERLPEWFRERIKKIRAKINWQTRKGQRAYFNVAVHQNHIPVDKALTILAHLTGINDSAGRLGGWVDSVIECGLFPKVKRGKFEYKRRCQDGELCELCNYLNISDGLKTLFAAYDKSAFYRGGNWFAFTVAPRTKEPHAKALGRVLTPADWEHENPDSVVYREAHHHRVFRFPDALDPDEYEDWSVETRIRRFLGAIQFVFGKLVKNGWLDGIRAKVENSIQFLPFASHQHWHGVGSSNCEHDPQKMAQFIKEKVDAVLAQNCPRLYVDVMVAVISTPADLRRWIKYMNKTVNLVQAVESVYNRHPGLRRIDPAFRQFIQELQMFPERSRRVFGMIRQDKEGQRDYHTYMLRRRFVRGNHKLGECSILSESERHRLWREAHAMREQKRRGKQR